MGMNLNHGGHLTHGSPVNMSGAYFHIVPYGVNEEGFLDYEEIKRIALEAKPKLIVSLHNNAFSDILLHIYLSMDFPSLPSPLY